MRFWKLRSLTKERIEGLQLIRGLIDIGTIWKHIVPFRVLWNIAPTGGGCEYRKPKTKMGLTIFLTKCG